MRIILEVAGGRGAIAVTRWDAALARSRVSPFVVLTYHLMPLILAQTSADLQVNEVFVWCVTMIIYNAADTFHLHLHSTLSMTKILQRASLKNLININKIRNTICMHQLAEQRLFINNLTTRQQNICWTFRIDVPSGPRDKHIPIFR